MYLCVRGYQTMKEILMYLCVRGTMPRQRVVVYLCVRGYQTMIESGHVFVC